MTLTWIQTDSVPEIWELGILRGRRLCAIRAGVEQMPDGEWYWWRTKIDVTRGDDRVRFEGGIAASRATAMTIATGENKVNVRELQTA